MHSKRLFSIPKISMYLLTKASMRPYITGVRWHCVYCTIYTHTHTPHTMVTRIWNRYIPWPCASVLSPSPLPLPLLFHPNTHSSSRNYWCRCWKLFSFLSFAPFHLFSQHLMAMLLRLKTLLDIRWVGVIDRDCAFFFFFFIFFFDLMMNYNIFHTGITWTWTLIECIVFFFSFLKSLIKLEFGEGKKSKTAYVVRACFDF